MSTGMPRPLSTTVTELSACTVTLISSAKPAMASSTELSTTSQTRWCKPISPVEPIYIAGRKRTASRPPRTLIDFASYLWPPCGVPTTFSFSPIVSPGAATSRVPAALDRLQVIRSAGPRSKLIFCEARKACLRIDPYVALPCDPGRASGLVGFLLHPISRSETWRRLMFLQARELTGSWRRAAFVSQSCLADVSIWRNLKTNRQPKNCTRFKAFSQVLEMGKNLCKLPVSLGLRVRKVVKSVSFSECRWDAPAGADRRVKGALEITNYDFRTGPDSDAHRHDDIAVAVGLISERPHLAGGLFVFQFDADGTIGRGTEKIQHVAGIEADGDGLALEFFLDALFCLAVFRAGGGDLDAFFRDGQLHGVRALIGKLRDAAHRIAQFGPLDDHIFVIVPKQHRFVIGELAGQNARNQQAMADLEKKVTFVFRKFDVRVGAGGAGKFFNFVHGLLRNQHFHFAIQTCKFVIGLRKRQAVAVRRHHRQRVRLQNQQAAIQCVARLFQGDRKFRFPDEVLKNRSRNLHQRVGHHRKCGEVLLGHTYQLVFLIVADDFHPMIVQKLDLNL